MPRIVDHDERREELAEAACKVIAKIGVGNLRLTDVARQAGCTTGALQHYFPNKQALVIASVTYLTERLEKSLKNLRVASLDDLRAYLLEMLPIGRRRSADVVVWLNFWTMALTDKDARAVQSESHKIWVRRLCEYLETLQVQGEISSKTDLVQEAEAIIALVDGLAMRAVLDPKEWPKSRLCEQVDLHLERLR